MGKKKLFKGSSKMGFFRLHNNDYFGKNLAALSDAKTHIRRHPRKKCCFWDPQYFWKCGILVKKSSKSVEWFKSYGFFVFIRISIHDALFGKNEDYITRNVHFGNGFEFRLWYFTNFFKSLGKNVILGHFSLWFT